MHNFSRRQFIQTGTAVLTAAAVPQLIKAQAAALEYSQGLSEKDFRALTSAALDAAKSNGATYADAHFKSIRSEVWEPPFLGISYPTPKRDSETGFSVRAMVKGYWGFAAMHGIMTLDDAARLGKAAADQARTVAKGKDRGATLAPLSSIANGTWVMPVEVDPFTVSFEEKADFFTGMNDYMQRQKYGVGASSRLHLRREERASASSEGSFTLQTVYNTTLSLSIGVPAHWESGPGGGRFTNFGSNAGAGWEYVKRSPYKENADEMIAEALRNRRHKPVEVGRYDVVFDAQALSGIIGSTIGAATELDRAMGYEANDTGTSYFSDPLEMLGTFKVGSPLLNVTANRSMPCGSANVKWDEEGVEPAEVTLVKDGILNDFQTTRESATWISEYYGSKNIPLRSNGCAGSRSVVSPTTQVAPNLVMRPDKSDISFEDMIKDTKKGLAVLGGSYEMDHQLLNGAGNPDIIYEIVNGKIGRPIKGAQYLFRAPEFWKSIVAIGGEKSVMQFGRNHSRGGGNAPFSVSCVPAKVAGVAVIDVMKKA